MGASLLALAKSIYSRLHPPAVVVAKAPYIHEQFHFGFTKNWYDWRRKSRGRGFLRIMQAYL